VERITVKLPCGGVECWEGKEMGQCDEGDEGDEGILETDDGFMIAWFEEVEEGTLWRWI
jgi:hypothetical protein